MHKEALAWSENPRHFDDQRAHYQFNLVNTVFEPNTKTVAVLFLSQTQKLLQF